MTPDKFIGPTAPTHRPIQRPGVRSLCVPLLALLASFAGNACQNEASPTAAFANDGGQVGPAPFAPGTPGTPGTSSGPPPGTGPGATPGTPTSGAGGTAYLRLCHDVTFANAKVDVTLEIGGQRLTATTGACAPRERTPCLAVPAGTSAIRYQIGDQLPLSSSFTLAPGTAYFVESYLPRDEKNQVTAVLPNPIPLESPAACDGLDAKEAGRILDTPLPLEIARGKDFAFARPVGLVPKPGASADELRFEAPEAATASISRFVLTHVGRLPAAQVPAPEELVAKQLTARKLRLVGEIEKSRDYAAGVGDSGQPGPGRYVRMMAIRHWALPSDDLPTFTTKDPPTLRLFMGEIAYAVPLAADVHHIPRLLKAIAWGISAPAESLVTGDVVGGTWRSGAGSLSTGDWVDNAGNWTGGSTIGTATEIEFGADGRYKMLTMVSASCSGMSTPSCIVQAAFLDWTQGRYALDGGVLVLAPSRCEERHYDRNNLLKGVGGCERERLPIVLRVSRGEKGKLVLSGLGLHYLQPRSQRWYPHDREGSPGAWDVKEPIDSAPMAAWNACALDEREPNDSKNQPGPIALGSPITACLPTLDDRDVYDLAVPVTDRAGGYFVAELQAKEAAGNPSAEVDGLPFGALYGLETKMPTETLSFFWAGLPGKKHPLIVKAQANAKGWFRYGLQVTYTRIDDAFEPNDEWEQARPLALGRPASAYFFRSAETVNSFMDTDHYAVDVAAGPVTVKIENVPADIEVRGAVYTANEGFVDSFETAKGAAHTATVTIETPGRHIVRVYGVGTVAGKIASRAELPDSYTRPYRLTVTQP